MSTFEELEARIAALEAQPPVVLDQLPLRDLNRWLNLNGDQDIDLNNSYQRDRNGGVALSSFAGPWAGAPPATPTAGLPFTIPVAGDYLLLFFASAFVAAAPAFSSINCYIDAVLRGTQNLFINAVQHQVLVPAIGVMTLSAGPHYLAYQQAAGASDANDRGSFVAVKIS